MGGTRYRVVMINSSRVIQLGERRTKEKSCYYYFRISKLLFHAACNPALAALVVCVCHAALYIYLLYE